MEIFEHSPFEDVYIPYIVEPLHPEVRLRIIWETLESTSMPAITRWILFRLITRPNRIFF